MVSKKQIGEIENVIAQMALQELVSLRDGISERITTLQDAEKDKFIASIKAQAEQLGLNLGDLAPALGLSPMKRSTSGSSTGKRASIAAPLYINPADPSETFSGRGRRANWLIREMAKMGLNEKAEIPEKFHNPARK